MPTCSKLDAAALLRRNNERVWRGRRNRDTAALVRGLLGLGYVPMFETNSKTALCPKRDHIIPHGDDVRVVVDLAVEKEHSSSVS